MKLKTIKQQQGIATVLIVLLVGVALTASTLGVIYSVKSTQDKQVTSHATSNAQSAAWALAEAARAYLELNTTDLNQLRANIDTANAGGAGFPLTPTLGPALAHLNQSTITFNSYNNLVDGNIQFDLSINAIDTISKAATQLNVIFAITPGQAPQKCYEKGENRLSGDVLGDGIDLYVTGPNTEMVVDGSYGSIDAQHSIHGISTFRVTGDLGLEGTANDGAIKEVKANGSIKYVIASGTVDENTKISAGGDIIIDATDRHIGQVIAGGNITWINHNGLTDSMQAGVKITGPITTKDGNGDIQNVSLVDGYREFPVTAGDPLGVIDFQKDSVSHQVLFSRADLDLDNRLTITNAYSLSDILFNGYSKPIENATAANSIICTSTPAIATAVAGESIENCAPHPDSDNIGQAAEVKEIVEANMIQYVPVDLPPSLIADADKYIANYSFRAVGPNNDIQVEVRNIRGLAEDPNTSITYTLSNASTLVTMDTPPVDTGFNICGDTTGCITFTNDALNPGEPARALRTEPDEREVVEAAVPAGLWSITGTAEVLAPGIYYFDRDLLIKGVNNNNYVNSILSAGSIKPVDPIRIFAVNGVPDNVICNNQNFDVTSTQRGADVTIVDLPGVFFPLQNGIYPYPTNLCGEINGVITRKPSDQDYIGQFGLMAGQENNDVNPVSYQGGNIYFGSSFEVYGRVIAGNAIKLDAANVEIYGLIGSEARAEGLSKTQNDLNGTIDIKTGYMDVLDKSDPDDGQPCVESNGQARQSNHIWSRYL